jgi:hypothetical protein
MLDEIVMVRTGCNQRQTHTNATRVTSHLHHVLSRLSRLSRVMSVEQLVVNAPADFHVHLRQGALCRAVVPDVRKGGMHLVYVMVGTSLLILVFLVALIIKVAQSTTSHHHDRSGDRLQKGASIYRCLC